MPESGSKSSTPEIPFRERLSARPWSVDWFNALRWVQARNPGKPRLGSGGRPADEPVRVSQRPSLQFAPATLIGFELDRAGRPRLEQLAFGLFGPNGPLPLHLTEYVRSLCELDKDHGLRAFADIFNHRFAMLFFRAWAEGQSCASLDRPAEDRFGHWIASLIGYGASGPSRRDSVPDSAKRFMAGHLVRPTRNPEGLVSILSTFFDCAFRVEEWVRNRLSLASEDQTALGAQMMHSRLGQGAVCGASVYDRQHRIRLHAGPLDFAAYERFLPAQWGHDALRDWVRNYVGFELHWDLRLVLRGDEVPTVILGGTQRLGWTTWLAGNPGGRDRGELVIDCERRAAMAACPTVTDAAAQVKNNGTIQ